MAVYRTGNPWVKLTKELTFVHGTEPVGRVGILVGPAQTGRVVGTDDETGETIYEFEDEPDAVEIHLVYMRSGTSRQKVNVEGKTVYLDVPVRGGDTQHEVIVKHGDYELVTDRRDIPKERLATYHPDWRPREWHRQNPKESRKLMEKAKKAEQEEIDRMDEARDGRRRR